MYSPRVAYQEGRKIGRSLDHLRVNDADLRSLVISELEPTIILRRSDEDRASDAATVVAAVAVILAVAAVAFWIAQQLWPEARFIALVPATLKAMSGMVALLAAAGSAALVVLARYFSSRATNARNERVELLLDEGFRGAREVVDARRQRAGLSVHRASSTSPRDRPNPVFDGQLSPRDAEELAAQWMRSLGALDARTTRYIGDGGIDVESSQFIAQVKHYAAPVGPGAIRELAGVASIDPGRRRALFFSTAGFQPGAVDFADRTLVALFHMIPGNGDLRAQNGIARTLLERGLGRGSTDR